MTDLFPIAFAALEAAAMLLPTGADRFRGALGLPALALGVASLPFLPNFRGPSLTVWISAALLLLGPAMLLLATWNARARLGWRNPAVPVVAVAVGLSVTAAWPTLTQGGVLPALLTAGALGLGTLLDWMIGAALGAGRAVRRLDARLGRRDRTEAAPPGRAAWLTAVGVVLVVVVVRALVRDAPFGPESEIGWTAAAGLAAILAAALWPLHRLLPGGPFALAAGALLLLLCWDTWALGMAHWQPIGVGMGVASVLWAGPTNRPALALVGAGVAACFSAPAAAPGAWVLLAAGATSAYLPPQVLAGAGALGLYLVMPSLLGAEVLFTVLLAWGATVVLGAGAARATQDPSGAR
ncbi:MAG TPA: hypothetical protein VFV65_02415 [Gemmatimonadales bacterium]|nr:hypothetical protein [Gemmatimonadales bacterium]